MARKSETAASYSVETSPTIRLRIPAHTGRPLVVDTHTVLAYTCLTAAAAVRVLGPGLPGVAYVAVLGLSGLFWTAAFVLFLWVYAPILLTPRADGKAG